MIALFCNSNDNYNLFFIYGMGFTVIWMLTSRSKGWQSIVDRFGRTVLDHVAHDAHDLPLLRLVRELALACRHLFFRIRFGAVSCRVVVCGSACAFFS